MEEKIVLNEEVVEMAEDVVTSKSGKAVKAVVGVGVAALVGRIVYKRVIKPVIAKLKAKKNSEEMTDEDRIETPFELDENGHLVNNSDK